MENTKASNSKQIAGAIIIAGVLIAGAILLKGKTPTNVGQNGIAKVDLSKIKIKDISADDHILGNPNSKITIVTYSDTECPFSKMFQTTMNEVITKQAQKGQEVAWVYRHFPIAQLHPKAFHEAVATECAWEQGDQKISANDKFSEYLKEVYLRTESNNKLDPAELTKIAKDIGLDMDKFNTCLSSDKYADKVKADIADGEQAGTNGTPKSFILKDGKIVDTIDGAYPVEEVLKKIDTALK